MEKVQHTEPTVEVFENDIQLYLSMFCEENSIEDLRKESQQVWNSCLRYIYKHVFKPNPKILKSNINIYNNNSIMQSNYNSYNYKLVSDILDIYIYDMCMRYDKEVSIIGFTTLTGIDESVVYDWGNNSTRLSTESAEIYKKLSKMREESLSNKLATGNKNPVGILAILNRHYSWNLPGVSRESTVKQSLSVAELPKLGLHNTQESNAEPLEITNETEQNG